MVSDNNDKIFELAVRLVGSAIHIQECVPVTKLVACFLHNVNDNVQSPYLLNGFLVIVDVWLLKSKQIYQALFVRILLISQTIMNHSVKFQSTVWVNILSYQNCPPRNL